jgi:hypothetical protein
LWSKVYICKFNFANWNPIRNWEKQFRKYTAKLFLNSNLIFLSMKLIILFSYLNLKTHNKSRFDWWFFANFDVILKSWPWKGPVLRSQKGATFLLIRIFKHLIQLLQRRRLGWPKRYFPSLLFQCELMFPLWRSVRFIFSSLIIALSVFSHPHLQTYLLHSRYHGEIGNC